MPPSQGLSIFNQEQSPEEVAPNLENKETVEALKDLLRDAITLDKQLPDGSKLFNRDLATFYDSLSDLLSPDQPMWSPETGMIKPGTAASTTRDGWGHGIRGPSIAFETDKEGRPCVKFSGNHCGGPNDEFSSTVIKGIEDVTIDANGGILGLTDRWANRPLTEEEIIEFTDAIRRVDQKVQGFIAVRSDSNKQLRK